MNGVADAGTTTGGESTFSDTDISEVLGEKVESSPAAKPAEPAVAKPAEPDKLEMLKSELMKELASIRESMKPAQPPKPTQHSHRDMDVFERGLNEHLDRREQEKARQIRQAVYQEELQRIYENNKEDFADGSLEARMTEIATNGIEPEDLFFLANKERIIARIERNAVLKFKAAVEKKRSMAAASSGSPPVAGSIHKKDSEMSFEEIMRDELNKLKGVQS